MFDLHGAGGLEFMVGRQFDLAEVSATYAHVESRESHAKVVLAP